MESELVEWTAILKLFQYNLSLLHHKFFQHKDALLHYQKSRENDTPHGDVRYGFKAQDIMALEGDNPVIIDNEDSFLFHCLL